MTSESVLVFVIDDDKSVRDSLSLFLKLEGYKVKSFESSEDYLAMEPYQGAGCIILDVNLAGKSGPELQEELISRNSLLPIIFITGYGNFPMSVQTLKKGAVNYLVKPFSEEDILLSVSEAITKSHKALNENQETKKAQHLISTLTPREFEVLTYILTGLLNKQIAGKLDVVEHTVKLHKRHICEKFGVKSVPEMFNIAYQAGILYPEKK